MLLTIGYERRSTEEVIALLRDAGVGMVADVRERPMSRRPGFSKARLQQALEAHGIKYVHMGALGSPRELRMMTSDLEMASECYRQQVLSCNDDALRRLTQQASRGRVCLLCYEREPELCHRILIAEEICGRNRRIKITHL